MTIVGFLIMIGTPLAAFALGVRWGRKWSLIGVCVGVVLLTAIASRALLIGAEDAAVGLLPNHPWNVVAGLGMGAVFAALALVGPMVFRIWQPAFLLSLAITLAFILLQLPFLFAACALFGACI